MRDVAAALFTRALCVNVFQMGPFLGSLGRDNVLAQWTGKRRMAVQVSEFGGRDLLTVMDDSNCSYSMAEIAVFHFLFFSPAKECSSLCVCVCVYGRITEILVLTSTRSRNEGSKLRNVAVVVVVVAMPNNRRQQQQQTRNSIKSGLGLRNTSEVVTLKSNEVGYNSSKQGGNSQNKAVCNNLAVAAISERFSSLNVQHHLCHCYYHPHPHHHHHQGRYQLKAPLLCKLSHMHTHTHTLTQLL